MKLFRKKLLCIMVTAMLFVASGYVMPVHAATPRVILTDYTTEKDVYVGDNFSLKLNLLNTAARKITNLKITLIPSEGTFIPAEGAGCEYRSEIAAKTEELVEFSLKTLPSLKEGTYKCDVKLEYAGSDGLEYSTMETVYIPVYVDSRISMTDLFLDKDMLEVGDSVEIVANINNLGQSTIKNVSVLVGSKDLNNQSSYIGNIEPGKSGTMDLITKAVAVTDEYGEEHSITITYENSQGETITTKETFDLKVTIPVYDNLTMLIDKEAKTEIPVAYKYGVCVAGILVLWIVFHTIRKKRKQKKIDELFD